ALAYSPDATIAFANNDHSIRLWDLNRPMAKPAILNGHKGTVNFIAFSPDGTQLASASDGKTILVWNRRQPRSAPRRLIGHDGEVTSLAFSPDGTRLVSGSKDQTIRLWDLRQTTPMAEVVMQGYVLSVAVSRTYLASSVKSIIQLRNLRTGVVFNE